MKNVSRRSFLGSAGVAAGAVAVAASPAVAAVADPGAVETSPTTAIGPEPVIAIVRDAGQAEVTVIVGTTEKTYKDPKLAGRLLKVARQNVAGRGNGEVA